ncbi:MAG: VirD4-like conjugal transfer protein, CD1115 family [Oscillospiraceae bacterium]
MFYLTNRTSYIYNLLNDESVAILKLNIAMGRVFNDIRQTPLFIDTTKSSILMGLIGFILIWLIYLYNLFTYKKYMHGIEYGSSQWGTIKDIEPYIDQNNENNTILTKTESISIDTRKTKRNNNVIVVGGSGSGKTRMFIKPNLMQTNSSYIMTDPKGTVLLETGDMFRKAGYKIKVFNLVDMSKSDRYNLFNYIENEEDILSAITTLVDNTNAKNHKSDFWEKAEKLLLQAIFSYIITECLEEEKNMNTVMKLLLLAEVKEDDENYSSPLDILFLELESKYNEHFAVSQYKLYKQAAGKSAKSILISIGARLSPFNISSIKKLVEEDDLNLKNIVKEKTILYVIISDNNNTYNFLVSMMYQQLFQTLTYIADTEHDGFLPIPVNIKLDEFANTGKVPLFIELLATCRSRNISIHIILQSISQLKSMYKDDWEGIISNCDTFLYLGGNEASTHKFISEKCGKTTIDNMNINETKGQTGSYTMNNQNLGRDIIMTDEVGRMPNDKCILHIRGCNCFYSDKYDITQHKNYKLLSDYDNNNTYKYIPKRQKEDLEFFKNVNKIKNIEIGTELLEKISLM